jgi:EpsI family protein
MSNRFAEDTSLRVVGETSRRLLRTWLAVILFLGLFAYLPMFISLWVSHMGASSYYAHWFLIPPVSALLIWLKKDTLRQLDVRPCGWGLPIAIGSLFLHVLAVWFRTDFISAFSFVVAIWGLALYLFGERIVREISFPLLFLVFMIPLPGSIVAPIAFHMKMLSGKLAVATYNLLGGTAILTGSKISFTEGDPLWMGYECSGLKSVISLSALGAVAAHLGRLPRPRKIILFLCSFPLAILSNSVRVTSLCFAADKWGVNSTMFKTFHDTSSPVVFLLVLGGLLGIHRLLSIGKAADKSQSGGIRETATPDRNRLLALIPKRKFAIISVLLFLSAALSLPSPHFFPSATRMSSLRPVEFPESIGEWKTYGTDSVQREEVLSILKTESIALRSYRAPSGCELEVLVVASDTDRQAFHPPEICMIGAGNEVLERWKEPISVNLPLARRLYLNAFVRGTGGRPDTLVLYWYMAGKGSMGSRAAQQLALLLNGARRTPIIGAMIRVTVPLGTMEKDGAVRSAKEFIRSLVPLMPRLLMSAGKAKAGTTNGDMQSRSSRASRVSR